MHQRFFALSQRHLIADLVEVSHELGAFAKETSNSDVDFVECAKHLFNLFGSDEGWQVEHDADSQPGADIGRARGQVTQFLGEGVREFAFEQIVQFVHPFPCRGQIQSALHDLETQVVFFVDHDAEAFLGIQDDRAGSFRFAQLVADELSFHQELPIEIPELGNIDILGIGGERECIDRAANGSGDRNAVFVGAFANEWKLGKIPCESDSAAHDDIRFGAIASHPFASLLR